MWHQMTSKRNKLITEATIDSTTETFGIKDKGTSTEHNSSFRPHILSICSLVDVTAGMKNSSNHPYMKNENIHQNDAKCFE